MTFLPLLLALQNRSPFIPPPNAQEPLVALDFLREANVGLVPDEVNRSYAMHGNPLIEPPDKIHPKSREYRFTFGTVGVDVTTGRVCSYMGGGDGHHAVYNGDGGLIPRALSDQAAKKIVRRLYNASGMSDEIVFFGVEDLAGGGQEDVRVAYSPALNGVPYWEGGGWMDLDRQTGFLHNFVGSTSHADPPTSTIPRLSLEGARAQALRLGVDRQGEAMTQQSSSTFRLTIWVPSQDNAPEARNTLQAKGIRLQDYEESANARAARKSNRGVLAYVGRFEGSNPGDPLDVVLDAQTGEALSFERSFSALAGRMGNGGLSGTSTPARPALLPATGSRPWRVAVGTGPLVGPVAATLTPAPGIAPTAGEKVDLTDGRAAFPALYDPSTGLIGIVGKAYKPSPALADLLRRRARG